MRLNSLSFTLVGLSQYAENHRIPTNFTESKTPLTFFRLISHYFIYVFLRHLKHVLSVPQSNKYKIINIVG